MKMKEIALAFIFIVSALHQGVTARKPRIIPAKSWEVIEDGVFLIQEGDELRIECQGEGRLQFSTLVLRGIVDSSDFMTSRNETTGVYTFVCPHANIQNTGWYACAEEGVEIWNDDQTIEHPSENISWIYVYVNSLEPFAIKEASDGAFMIAGSDGVIPCRPTSPNLPVRLEIQGSNIPVPEDTTYDPRIGFILKKVGKERNWQRYMCKLDGAGSENGDNPWPLYSAIVQDATPLEAPTINRDRLHHVVRGKNLTLDCRITVTTGTKFSLKWIVPSSIPKERLLYSSHTPTLVELENFRRTWKRELTILNVTRTDGGEYICVAQSLMDANNRAQTSTEIEIFDPDFTYTNVSADSHEVVAQA